MDNKRDFLKIHYTFQENLKQNQEQNLLMETDDIMILPALWEEYPDETVYHNHHNMTKMRNKKTRKFEQEFYIESKREVFVLVSRKEHTAEIVSGKAHPLIQKEILPEKLSKN